MTHHTGDSSRYVDTINDHIFRYITRCARSGGIDPQGLFQHLGRGERYSVGWSPNKIP